MQSKWHETQGQWTYLIPSHDTKQLLIKILTCNIHGLQTVVAFLRNSLIFRITVTNLLRELLWELSHQQWHITRKLTTHLPRVYSLNIYLVLKVKFIIYWANSISLFDPRLALFVSVPFVYTALITLGNTNRFIILTIHHFRGWKSCNIIHGYEHFSVDSSQKGFWGYTFTNIQTGNYILCQIKKLIMIQNILDRLRWITFSESMRRFFIK